MSITNYTSLCTLNLNLQVSCFRCLFTILALVSTLKNMQPSKFGLLLPASFGVMLFSNKLKKTNHHAKRGFYRVFFVMFCLGPRLFRGVELSCRPHAPFRSVRFRPCRLCKFSRSAVHIANCSTKCCKTACGLSTNMSRTHTTCRGVDPGIS